MNQEYDDDAQEMQPEYDIRGGVRGKYLDRYRGGITFQESPFVLTSTATTPFVGCITSSVSYPTLRHSSNISIGTNVAADRAA